MFLHVSVILSAGGGGMMSHPVWSHVPSEGYGPGGWGVWSWEGVWSRGGKATPPPGTTKVSDTHPTGMLSCYEKFYSSCIEKIFPTEEFI